MPHDLVAFIANADVPPSLQRPIFLTTDSDEFIFPIFNKQDFLFDKAAFLADASPDFMFLVNLFIFP